ncbi:MAG TPA: NAD-dependent succinate-semialdehyde dehydrogenase [Salinivirgaceae bacterium]|mgnify:CR=1 FL=1|nr:NAD-dependent succinate-semialdehyde dehydrogenase [Salinivirgaceae bacterium]
MEVISSINSYTGEKIADYQLFNDRQVDSTLQAAAEAFLPWSIFGIESRASLLRSVSQKLLEKKETLAALITAEMGKVTREARAEIEKCAWVCNYYADNTLCFLEPKTIETNYSRSFVAYNPLGTVLAIMPWNFPFWQVFRAAAPILMAGNTMILKHASNVSGCALAIEKLFAECGFPRGVFSTILVRGVETAKIIADKRIAAVTLTGSTPAGESVAATAGKYLKKCVLELGGSDPYIILDDADLQQAADKCVTGRLINAGQSCIAAKRFIVVDSVYDEFLHHFIEKMKKATTGDPTLEATTYGPLANRTFREDLHQQVLTSIQNGAKALIGGTIDSETCPLYPPTVLVDVKPGMPAYCEELFGPVASVIRAKNVDESIQIANDTMFGLGAAVFTRDIKLGTLIAEQKLRAGCCFVNDFVKSDPRLPFGGIKMSGYGRELSIWGMHEFVNIKTVAVNTI